MHDPAKFRSMHKERFGAEPAIFVGPGRVNLIGEHTDYAEGFVMPAAINFATLAGISPRTDGKIAIFHFKIRTTAKPGTTTLRIEKVEATMTNSKEVILNNTETTVIIR